ncbi:MAG: hypothetical protein UR12_C0017G0016 [candidate division TM6 bacterium GW2011_GWF2_30_66]|nr:MAG: hypothetical protein UR12_C0017G0016 [candidate division TM6 bacterium GW2011_GWF2_30_66]
MENSKSRILIVLFLIVSVFPAYKIIRSQLDGNISANIGIVDFGLDKISLDADASIEDSSAADDISSDAADASAEDYSSDDAGISEPETTQEEASEESSNEADVETAIEEVSKEVPKNSTISNLVIIAEHVIKKSYKDKEELKLGNIARKILNISSEKTELEKELNKITLKKPVVKRITKGFRIKGIVVINKHQLNTCIEVGKKDNVWYSVFYVRSPKTWKVSEYFPQLLDINKILPGLDKSILGKYTKSDLFEFAESYFYISTVAMDEYKKFGKIIKGAGFSGKVKFAGALELLDKTFSLDGQYIEISGSIEPKLIGSKFTMKIPTTKTIIPEVLKVPGKADIKLIPGFKVDLMPYEFTITFVKGLPEFKGAGGIKVFVPYEETPIEFSSNVDFEDKKLKLSGAQKIKMSKLFGLDGFSAEDFSLDISWDFGSKNILPKSLNIKGKLQSGKSKLDLTNFEVSTSEDKKINMLVSAKGSLYTKDFAQFWLDAIIKDPKIQKADVLKLVPEIVLEDVTLDINWVDSIEERSAKLKINKTDIKLGDIVKGLIPASVVGLEKELNEYSLKKAVVDYYKGGLRIRSNVSIKGKPIKASLEIAKNDESKWYSLFYLESPEKWKLSELLPDFLTAKKLFPKMDKALLDKLSTPDLFEFEKSFFYISTIDIPEYQKSVMPKKAAQEKKVVVADGEEIEESTEAAEKVAKEKITISIVKGVGFSGKAKFIGAFDFFDKLLGLNNKSLKISGNITSKLIDSDFSIKVPTTKTIIPETLKIDGKDVKLIPGFKVDLMPQDFKIKFVKGLPEFKGEGGIKVFVPNEDTPLEFSSNISFEDKNLKISGDQKTKISKLFGVEGLVVDGCHADISWDASSINPIPKSVNVTGKIVSGKSDLKMDLSFSLEDKKPNLGFNATGNLLVKDFASFWLNVIVKDKKIANYVTQFLPDFKLEDVIFTANWADKEEDRKLLLKVKKADIKLGEIAKILIPSKDGQKSDIEKYLDKFSISSLSAEYYKKGIKVKGSTFVNNNPLDVLLEACKDDEKGWYSLFYLKSPDKWKVSDYIPDFLNAKTLFPNLDPKILSQLEKPDIFEFSESYFYISTADLKNHGKIGDLVQGVGFKGKAKFIGILDIMDKIFALKGEPLEITGDFRVPKVFGSKLAIKIPTTATIVPQSIVVNGKTQDLIKGFQIDLSPHEFAIKLIEDVPYVQLDATGGINVTVPFINEKLDFFSKIKFSGKQMSLSGGQKNKLENVLGVKGLGLDGCEIGLNWDFGVSGQWASTIGVATFGVGAIAVALPTGFIIEGGLSSQKPGSTKKCALNIKTDFSLNSTAGIDLKYESKGTLFARDFAEFWLDVMVKTPDKQNDKKFKEDFMKNVPDFTFEDVNIKGAWAKDADKELILSASKVELIKDVPASMSLKVSSAGISGSGALSAPISLPDKKNPVFELTKSLTNKNEGPSFSVDCTISPIKIGLKADAGLLLKDLFPGFKPIESESKIDISEDGLKIESKTKLLDFDSNLKIVGKLGTPIKLDDWEIVGGFDQKVTEEMSKNLKSASEGLLKVNYDIKKQQAAIEKDTEAAKNKALKDIKAAETKAIQDINKFFKDSKNAAKHEEGKIWGEILEWEKACNSKPGANDNIFTERFWCTSAQVTTRKIALEAVKIYGNIGADVVSAFAKLGTIAVSNVGAAFTSAGSNIKKDFEQRGLAIAEAFTRVASDITKIIDDFTKNIFTIHSLNIEAKVADVKLGKLPKIELDATIAARRAKRTMQLDVKNPGDFIKNLAADIAKDTIAIISGKISEAEKTEAEKTKELEKKVAAEIKAAEDKAAAEKK